MKCNIKEGTFVNKKGPGNKEFLDFMIKCGRFNYELEMSKMFPKGIKYKITLLLRLPNSGC